VGLADRFIKAGIAGFDRVWIEFGKLCLSNVFLYRNRQDTVHIGYAARGQEYDVSSNELLGKNTFPVRMFFRIRL